MAPSCERVSNSANKLESIIAMVVICLLYTSDSLPFFAGVFTNFSEDHIGGDEHKDMAEYLACKSLLFQKCATGVVNVDDPAWEGVTRGHTCALQTFGFSERAGLRASDDRLVTRPGFLGVAFSMTGRRTMEAEVDIPGRFNVYNALAAAAACTLFNVPDEAIRRGLARVKVKGRVEPCLLYPSIVSGIPLALAAVLNGALLCVTVVGIPFGLQCFKLAKLAFMPFGAEVVS